MDIELQTGTRNPSLRLENVGRFSDGQDYRLDLVVISDWVMARRPLYVADRTIDSFRDALEVLDRDLMGIARLDDEDRFCWIELEARSRGHIRVRGDIVGCGDTVQEVKFEFLTDQTCLRPLIADIVAVLRLPPGYGTS